MPSARVTWNIDVEDIDTNLNLQDQARTAAEEAWGALRDPNSTANVFNVTFGTGESFRVDLTEGTVS